MSTYCLYLYADILGYRSLLRQKGVALLKDTLLAALRDISAVVEAQKTAEATHLSFRPRMDELLVWQLIASLFPGELTYRFAFDTLFLFVKDLSEEQVSSRFGTFTDVVRDLYLNLLIRQKVKLRGVITVSDDYFIDDSLIITREIGTTYELERDQDLAAVVFNPKPPLDHLFHVVSHRCDATWVKTEVPFQSGSRLAYVLNPLNRQSIVMMKEGGLSLFAAITDLETELASPELDDRARLKVVNTKRFLEGCIDEYNKAAERKDMHAPYYEPDIDIEWF